MYWTRIAEVVAVLLFVAATSWGADIILNEYNAVSAATFLNGGSNSADDFGGRASDSYFGRIQGNGGDWFELVVVKDRLDMRGWNLDVYDSGALAETLTLTSHAIWSNLRSGTIITVSENVPSDISYNPAAGDWWINVQAHDDGDGLYIEKSSFPVSSSNWQLRIRNAGGTVVFGPAGEGVFPASGVGGTEVFRLETDPDATITRDDPDYDDGSDFSTFGTPNRWGVQDVNDLRPEITPATASLKVLAPNGGESEAPGDIITVRWQSQGSVREVVVEFSLDAGFSWSPVYPPNLGNTGQYRWLIPLVDSEEAMIRVSSKDRPAVFDVSDRTFVIIQTTAMADLNDDWIVGFFDFGVVVSAWAQ